PDRRENTRLLKILYSRDRPNVRHVCDPCSRSASRRRRQTRTPDRDRATICSLNHKRDRAREAKRRAAQYRGYRDSLQPEPGALFVVPSLRSFLQIVEFTYPPLKRPFQTIGP